MKALVALLVIGLVIYGLVWLVQARPDHRPGHRSDHDRNPARGRSKRPDPTPSRRPIGPDDDPDFLRGL